MGTYTLLTALLLTTTITLYIKNKRLRHYNKIQRESEAHAYELFDKVGDGLIECDPHMVVQRINKRAGEMLGLDTSAIVNRVFRPEDTDDAAKIMKSILIKPKTSTGGTFAEPDIAVIELPTISKRIRIFTLETKDGDGKKIASYTKILRELKKANISTPTPNTGINNDVPMSPPKDVPAAVSSKPSQ